MYANLNELPTQVLSSLSEEDAGKWMAEYNAADPKTEEEVMAARRRAWHLCESLPSSFSFKATATVDEIDVDGEVMDVDAIRKRMDAFVERGGPLQFEHTSYCVGTVWDWEPATVEGKKAIDIYANMFGGGRVYDMARKSFLEGHNSLSVSGDASRVGRRCDERGCYMRRDMNQLLEISVTSNPANKSATLIWCHDSSPIEGGYGMRMPVTSYTVHKSYDTCPILSLKHMLEENGIECHAREDGVFVPVSLSEYAEVAHVAKSTGLCISRVDGGAVLCERDTAIRRIYSEGLADGSVDEDGNIVGDGAFGKALDMGVMERRDGSYRLMDPSDDL